MKRNLLLSLLILVGFCAQALDMNVLVWNSQEKEANFEALFNWAVQNNKGYYNDPETKRVYNLTLENKGNIKQDGRQEVEHYEIDIPDGIIAMPGNAFCLHSTDNGTHAWIHAELTFPETKGWFSNDPREVDMKIGSQFTIYKIKVYRTTDGGKYCLLFNDEQPKLPLLPPTATGDSPYVLSVWDYRTAQVGDGEKALKWDTSGGLYRVWEGIEGVKDGERYPIDSKYLQEKTQGSYTYKFLNFCKVEDIAAEEERVKHPLMWASKDHDKYQEIVGKDEHGNYRGFAKETATKPSELYVIDFSVPDVNDGKGIYIEVPSLEDIKDGGWDTGSEDANTGVRRFFRGGIRFEFQDLREDFNKDNPWASSMRYVKWGHVFRLNEVARPLNAFPQFYEGKYSGTNPMMSGWADDFGPCEWNGYDYTPVTAEEAANGMTGLGLDFYASGKYHALNPNNDPTKDDPDPAIKGSRTVTTRAKKRGDSRLVSEYPFWLKRIYLEVAQAPDAINSDGTYDERYKHFYLSFEGEYDLSASITAESEWAYKEPQQDNHVSETPNIFRGQTVTFAEPAFSRFYNLNLTKITTGEYKDENDNYYEDFLPLLGCRLDDYLTRIGHNDQATRDLIAAGQPAPDSDRGHYLYMMEYHKGYDAHSIYSLQNEAGEKLGYHDVPDLVTEKLGAEYDYTASAGKYINNKDGKEMLTTDNTLVPNTKFVQSDQVSLYFDPEDPAYKPTDVYADYAFNFPNQIQTYERNGTFSIKYVAPEIADVIPMKVNANWRDKTGTQFGTTVEWESFDSFTPAGQKERFPVTTYALAHAGSETSDRPLDTEFQVVEHRNIYGDRLNHTLSADDNAYWMAHPEDRKVHNHIYTTAEAHPNSYWMHYDLDAWYNLAYPQGGVYSRAAIGDDEFATTDGTPVATTKAVNTALNRNVNTNNLTFQIRPLSLHASGKVEFTNTTTAITDVDADNPDDDAPAEYFNLQGQRIARPASGTLCIIRRGTTVTKALIP